MGLVMLIVVGTVGCASGPPAPPATDEGRIELAWDLFEKNDFRDAQIVLEEFLADRPGSRYMEEANYLLGRVFFEMKMDVEAEMQFRRILKDFPGGEFAPQANYYLALSLKSQSRPAELDQTETEAALTLFRSFVSRYPDHELLPRAEDHILELRTKLAEKMYKNAKTYRKRGFRKAEQMYLKRLIEEYGNTIYASRANLQLVESYIKDRKFREAVESAAILLAQYPESPEVSRAKRLHRDSMLQLVILEVRARGWDNAILWVREMDTLYPRTGEAREASGRLRRGLIQEVRQAFETESWEVCIRWSLFLNDEFPNSTEAREARRVLSSLEKKGVYDPDAESADSSMVPERR